MILQPPSILLEGASGCGKTYALSTLGEAGLEVFVIVTEPDGIGSLMDAWTAKGLPIEKLHWATVLPSSLGWNALTDMVNTIGTTGYEDIAKIKSGIGKTQTREPAMKLLRTLADFRCERDGTSYGDVSRWGSDRVLVLDSLSGLSIISMDLTIGYKPAAHQGEWGVAMNFLEKVILKLTSDRQCIFVMTAHVEKEMNEISGVQQIMTSTLGRKLAPKIPRFFSEVVYAKRAVAGTTTTFTWSTADVNVDLKNRSLPVSTTLQPSFKPVVEAFRRRFENAGGKLATPAIQPSTSSAPSAAKPLMPNAPMTRPATT